MAVAWVCWGWVEAGLVGGIGAGGLGEGVVDFEDDAFGAAFANDRVTKRENVEAPTAHGGVEVAVLEETEAPIV